MGDFHELMAYVKEKGFKSSEFKSINGDTLYLSCGIKKVFLENEQEEQKLFGLVQRFQKADYGNASEFKKDIRPGHEYGRYDVCDFDACEEDTAVWLHRAQNTIKVFFKFER